jgi:hypothetical protein
VQQYRDTTAALAACISANVPVILWGPPGQGKTSVIEQLAASLDLPIETVIASIREPSDFAGLPVVDHASGSVRLAPPSWAKRLASADPPRGLVFYDEVSTAPPAVQAALLRPILTGWVGDLQLPPEVRTIAAANPPELAAGGWEISAALANRFVHLNWELPAEVVRLGFTTGWPDPTAPAPDPAVAAQEEAKLRGAIAAFLSVRPGLTTKLPVDGQSGRLAFPTPRTWWMAAAVCGHARATGFSADVELLLLEGCVGVGAGLELATYLTELDLPDIEEVLGAPAAAQLDAARPDRIFAILNGAWAVVTHRLTATRWAAFGDLLAHIADLGHADLAYNASRPWAARRPVGAVPSQATWAALAPMLEAVELLPDLTMLPGVRSRA